MSVDNVLRMPSGTGSVLYALQLWHPFVVTIFVFPDHSLSDVKVDG